MGGIELFLYASTDAVFTAIYKEYKTPVTEEVEVFPRPGRFYAVAKVLAEDLCINYQKSFGLPYTIIRVGWSLCEDELLEIALAAGADDMQNTGELFEITCDPTAYEQLKNTLKEKGIATQVADGLPWRKLVVNRRHVH